ncbi:MAG: hypothetical protein IJP70_11825 [Bacteroidales bacterium]|nr:hypothetical protein [Bacteroidales bacterium]
MVIRKVKSLVRNGLKFLELKAVNRKCTGPVCIFQCKGGAPGLFSYLISVLGFVRWTHKHNLRPVIDLQSFKNTYLAEEAVGELNAWDYFFEQPGQITCDEAIQLPGVQYFDTTKEDCQGKIKSPWWDWEVYDQDSVTCRMWRAYAHRYIKLSKGSSGQVNQTWNRLMNKGDKVLGIQCRGTDYTAHKPKAHPVQPSPEMVMDKAEQLIRDSGYNKIFLATEDRIVFRKFKQRFGDMIISSDTEHVDYDGNAWINNVLPGSEQEKLEHGMAYLVSMMMLTRCNAFIAGRTSGSLGVMCLSAGFEYTYIWDLGVY